MRPLPLAQECLFSTYSAITITMASMCRHFTCSACLPRPGHHAEDGAAAAADEIHMAIYPVGDELHMSVQANQHPGDAAAYERYGKQWQVLSDEQKTALYPVINGRGAAKARRRHKR